MEIYILRHGIAEEAKGADSERALTQDGKKKLREVLRLARELEVAPALILTSPYKRALETAELAADVLGSKEPLVTTEALVPTAAPEDVWHEIRTYKNVDDLMVVGHEPLLSSVIGFLLGDLSLQIDLKKGGLTRVTVDQFGPQPRGTLKWLLPPKVALAG